jgi:hypothetical protein
MHLDNRQSPRIVIRYVAWIEMQDGVPMRDCIVRDISARGAKLGIITSTPGAVPDEFTLRLSPDGRVGHRCRVVWRSDENIGVTFLQTAEATPGPRR